MTENKALTQVLDQLVERKLGEAIHLLDAFLAVHPYQNCTDILFAIKTDYQMMTDYWRRGFKDPQLGDLYDNLLRRMYVLFSNIAVSYGVGHSSFLSSVYMRVHVAAQDWSPMHIREALETFVTDVAVLELEPPHTAANKRKQLYRQHQDFMAALFDYVLSSMMWNDAIGSEMEEILLSPTIDNNDQQLLTSAVMFSAMEHFDIVKFRLLVHVYQKSTDEYVRQRALVGWVLSMDWEIGRYIYPEEIQLVEKLVEEEACCKELTELQKQIVYCINAEQDNATIQNEIMPDLLKHQGFKVTRNGIVEQDEDTLNDILHPDEAERNLEKVEQSFNKMMDMQRQGSDIYFGGFSQMKRFPFFNEISNWFVPFYIEHPDIAAVVEKLGDNRFLNAMMKNGPFCNSDKYSFALAFEQVLNQLPMNIREMLNRGEAGIQELANEEVQNPTFIRRMYLQDIYRFFRIFPRRNEFRNRLSTEHRDYLFFASPIFTKTHLEPYFNEITAFLIKRKRLEDASYMMNNYGDFRRDFQFYMMAGYLAQNGQHAMDEDWHKLTAKECYERALQLEPENERAMAGYARSLFVGHHYDEALAAYEKLQKRQPEKKTYLLNKSVCLTNLGKYDEALKLLYKLNYEAPDDQNVNRVLAWTLTCDEKYEQAERIYNNLLSLEEPSLDDLLNFGYCLWFAGHIDNAADCFHRYLKESEQTPDFIIENEEKLIRAKGITEPEMQMMLYIL